MSKIKIKYLIIFLWLLPIKMTATPLPEMVEEIYQKLTDAVGDFQNTLPKLVIKDSKRFVAAYRRSDNTIFLEKAALEVSLSFPNKNDQESAIAFLIGHELTHFYQKHDWQVSGFASTFLSEKSVYDTQITAEQEADTYGAFISYLAGYQTIKIIPTLLEKIYLHYQLEDSDLSAYPSLANRKASGLIVCQQTQKLIDLYDTSIFLTAIGQYSEAAACFKYILNFVKCKELYLNYGTATLFAAWQLTPQTTPFFHYPLTVDWNLPLRASEQKNRVLLLQEAITALSVATNYDASYFPAFLNLICAYSLDNQLEKGTILIRALEKLPLSTIQQEKLSIVEAIILVQQQQRQQSIELLKTTKRQTTNKGIVNLININLQQLAGKPSPNFDWQDVQPILKDKIEGIFLLLPKEKTWKEKTTLSYTLDGNTYIAQFYKQAKSSIYTLSKDNNSIRFQWSEHPTITTTKGIQVGSPLQKVLNNYGKDFRQLAFTDQVFFMVYPNNGLIFKINSKNTVEAWGIYVK